MKNARIYRNATVAIVMACTAAIASADYMYYNGMGKNATVKVHAPGHNIDGRTTKAGQMDLTYGGVDYYGYCVDVDQYAGSSQVTELSYESLNNADMIAYLFETYSDSISNGTVAAALQSAIWEMLYETSGNYNLSSGTFRISHNCGALIAGNTMLATMPSSYEPAYELLVLHSNCKQDMLIGTDIPVPEPMTLTMLIGGGVVVLLGKRHRK